MRWVVVYPPTIRSGVSFLRDRDHCLRYFLATWLGVPAETCYLAHRDKVPKSTCQNAMIQWSCCYHMR